MYKDQEIFKKLIILQKYCVDNNLKLSTAESCTGGLISSLITSVDGSSKYFDRGFIVYSNESKIQLLNIDKQIIEKYGAVSIEVARAMALGAYKNSHSDICISVTGIAGPKSDLTLKPIGLVYIGCYYKKKILVQENNFCGSREDIRMQAANKSIEYISDLIIFDK